jgi:hypothetical protein
MMRCSGVVKFFGGWVVWALVLAGPSSRGQEAEQAPPVASVEAPAEAGAAAGGAAGESVEVREMRAWGGEAAAILQRALERLTASAFIEVEMRGRSYLMAVPSATRREAWERSDSGKSDVEVALVRRQKGGPTLEAMHSRTLGGSAGQLRGLLILQDPAQEEGLVMLSSGEEPTPTKLRMPMTFFREDRRARVGQHWSNAKPFVLEVVATRPPSLRVFGSFTRPGAIRAVAREEVGGVAVVLVEMAIPGGRELFWIEEGSARVLRSVVLSTFEITELVYGYREVEAPAEGDFDPDAAFARMLKLEQVEGGLTDWEALRTTLMAYRPPAEERGLVSRPMPPVERRVTGPGESPKAPGAGGAPAQGQASQAPAAPLPPAFGDAVTSASGQRPIDVYAIMARLRAEFAANRFVRLDLRTRISSRTASGKEISSTPLPVGPSERVRLILARGPGDALAIAATSEDRGSTRFSWFARVVATDGTGTGTVKEIARRDPGLSPPRTTLAKDEMIEEGRVRVEFERTLSALNLAGNGSSNRPLALALFERPEAIAVSEDGRRGISTRALGRVAWQGRPAALLLREHQKVAREYLWVDEQGGRLLHSVFVWGSSWLELSVDQESGVDGPPGTFDAARLLNDVQNNFNPSGRLSLDDSLASIVKLARDELGVAAPAPQGAGPGVASAGADTPGAAAEVPLDPALLGAVVLIESEESSGSGFIVELKGQPFVVSNLHVVGGAQNLKLTTVTGRRLEIVSTHAAIGRDVAIMRLAGTEHPVVLRLPDDLLAEAKIDVPVVVAGNRRGGRVATQERGRLLGIGPDRVEVNAAFQPGNSGSPIILPETGRVIGVAAYSAKREMDDSDKSGSSGVEQRWFGFRLDGVERWEPVDHVRWRREEKMLEDFARDTEAIFDALSGRLQEASESPRVAVPVGRFLERIDRMGNSRAQSAQEVQELLRALRALCNHGQRELEAAPTHDFFRSSEYWESSIPQQLRSRKQLAERIDEVSKNVDLFLGRLRR